MWRPDCGMGRGFDGLSDGHEGRRKAEERGHVCAVLI